MASLLVLAAAFGTLEVRTPAYGATISVDRQPRGKAPLGPLQVAAGLHLVEVFRRGHPPWSRLVHVAPGQVVRVEATWAALAAAPRAVQGSAPKVAPWQLSASAKARAGWHDGHHDVDLDQRWRLEGREPIGPGTAAALRVSAHSDLAGDRLLRRRAEARPTTIHLHEARVGGRLGRLALRGGRLLDAGPLGTPIHYDGGRARLRWGPTELEARGGARADPWVGRPDRPALGGLGLLVDGTHGAGVARWLYHHGHHADLDGRLRSGSGRAVGAASLAHGRPARLRLGAGWRGVDLRYLHARATASPFRPEADPIFDPFLAGHTAQLTVAGQIDRVHADIHAEGFRPSGAGAAHLNLGLTLRWPGALAATALIEGLWAQAAPAPSLRHRGRARGGLRWRHRRLHLGAHAGLAVLGLDTTERTLPEAGLDLQLGLTQRLSLAVDTSVAAVHPAWLPGGGPLVTGGLEVRLR